VLNCAGGAICTYGEVRVSTKIIIYGIYVPDSRTEISEGGRGREVEMRLDIPGPMNSAIAA
jgi:hypothetical protein